MTENKVNPGVGLISSDESIQLASIPEENIFHGSDRDAVLAQIEKEKTLALIKAWEESEKAKALKRAHKKVVEIGSWETTRKASIEDLIKKAEEDTDKKKVEYMEKVRNKIAELHKEAESKRLTISSKRGEDVAMVEDQANKFRSAGVARGFDAPKNGAVSMTPSEEASLIRH